jgi:hypothetical protein
MVKKDVPLDALKFVLAFVTVLFVRLQPVVSGVFRI